MALWTDLGLKSEMEACRRCCSTKNHVSSYTCITVYYSTLVGVWSIVINSSVCVHLSVCVYVCLSVSISLEPLNRTSQNFEQIPCGRGSVLLQWRCTTLCTSGFTADITFGRNGRETGKGWQHSAIHTHSLTD